jgi:protein TonB
MNAIRYEDDPWRRLPWQMPAALLLTLLTLMGFLRLLGPSPDMPSGPRPLELAIVELPPARPVVPANRPEPAVRPQAPPPREPPRAEPRPAVPPGAAPEPQLDTAPPREQASPTLVEPAMPEAVAPAPAVEAPPEPSSPSRAPIASVGPQQSARAAVPAEADRGGGRVGARAIYRPPLEVPETFRRRTLDVVAVARFTVAANGSAEVALTEPTGDPELNRALLESLKRWRFFPALENGRPTASTVDIRIPISVR